MKKKQARAPEAAGRSAPREKSSGRSRKRGRKRGLLRGLLYWCTVLGIWGVIAVGGIVLYYGAQMPSASTWAIPERPPNVRISAADGTIIANRGTTGGEALALDEMSPFIPEAVIAIEDRRFYSHIGFDPLGLARAFTTNLISRRTAQGGSTLTQQLAKNLFLSPERTLERKVQEVLLSFWLEHKFSKDQILAMYLNRMYFGSNAYGVEAAARRYFNKSARDVNLGEAALLAGLLKAPSRLSPARDPKAANDRAQVVLGAMRDTGFIDDEEVKTAMSQPPAKAKSYWSGAGQYVADMVMDEVKTLVGPIKEDLIVDTTIDPVLEKKAEKALTEILASEGRKLDATQGALVAIDGQGAIRALVGGADYASSQFNRAVKAKRQPGSAFKPFVYAAAMEIGDTPDSVRNDAPIRIGNWTPENYEQKYSGPVTLSTALTHSLNTIAAQLVMEAGPANVIKVAHRLGIESDLQPNASIALGTSEVSLLELTSAYAPFMNGGYKATPHVVTQIRTADGKILYNGNYGSPPRVLAPEVVTEMNSMMTRVINEGTGRAAKLKGWEAAGKTGTTQNSRDALFVGYTNNLATGIWFGNDDGRPMKRVTGGGLPAKAWHNFMTEALKGQTPKPLVGGGGANPTTPAGAEGDDPLFSLISSVLNRNSSTAAQKQQFPQAPAPVDGGVPGLQPGPGSAPGAGFSTGAIAPPADVGARQGGGPLPPADVGAGGSGAPSPHRSTLLDVIMGN